jgi:aldehyde dehydrogenase (NAD+)
LGRLFLQNLLSRLITALYFIFEFIAMSTIPHYEGIKRTRIADQLKTLRAGVQQGGMSTVEQRIQILRKLKLAIEDAESDLYEALWIDLKKSKEEIWITETGFVLQEIKLAIRKLSDWMKPVRVSTNLLNLPSRSYLYKEPLGVVLIIAPWNYPFQLLFNPLVGAIAAGNAVVLKASEFAPATAAVMRTIVNHVFEPGQVLFFDGPGAMEVPALMEDFRFDHVFYTGSTEVGKRIYEMAAPQLVPVTLELGGKSPCIVAEDANLSVAARRIVIAKFSNAGQMCVAPDYVLVHETIKEKLISAMRDCLLQFFGENPAESSEYGKIINKRQFDRLVSYLHHAEILVGGKHQAEQLYLEPTLIHEPDLQSPIMEEEIFGPILPILAYRTEAEAQAIIAQSPNPLAFYVFTESTARAERWIQNTPFGGGCVNNCSWHLTNHHLPFGGRGFSGTGRYHGQYSFDTFSHTKSVMKTPTWFDPAIKYPPLKGKLSLFKKIW